MDDADRSQVTAQEFGFVLAAVIAAVCRHGSATDWEGGYIERDFDELLTTAETLQDNRLLQEQIVSDVEIVAELYDLASYLKQPDPDFQRVGIITRRLWRAVKPFAD